MAYRLRYGYPLHEESERDDRERTRSPEQRDRRFRGVDYDHDEERYLSGEYERGYGAASPFHHDRPEGDYYRRQPSDARNYRETRNHDRTVDRLKGWMNEGPHTGRGPSGYQRSADRILEDAHERLTRHGGVDASNIAVNVEDGEITLEGTVDSRRAKRMAEDAVEDILGVKDVHNRLRVQRES